MFSIDDNEEMVNGEYVRVWLGDKKGPMIDGPYLGKVIKAKNKWVELPTYYEDGSPFIADDGMILKWERAGFIATRYKKD